MMSGYLDTRNLAKRLDELEGEFSYFEDAIVDAQEVLDELLNEEDLDREEVNKAYDNLRDAQADLDNFRDENEDELDELRTLREEISDFDSGVTLIPESEFESYTMDFYEEFLGEIPPGLCIDWEQTASDLSQDYSLITFEDEDYYYMAY